VISIGERERLRIEKGSKFQDTFKGGCSQEKREGSGNQKKKRVHPIQGGGGAGCGYAAGRGEGPYVKYLRIQRGGREEGAYLGAT